MKEKKSGYLAHKCVLTIDGVPVQGFASDTNIRMERPKQEAIGKMVIWSWANTPKDVTMAIVSNTRLTELQQMKARGEIVFHSEVYPLYGNEVIAGVSVKDWIARADMLADSDGSRAL